MECWAPGNRFVTWLPKGKVRCDEEFELGISAMMMKPAAPIIATTRSG